LTAFNSKRRYQKLAIAVRVLQNIKNLVISRCFAEDGKEMYQDSKRMCTAIVLLIKPFVWRRSRRRRRRGLLKLPIGYLLKSGAKSGAKSYRDPNLPLKFFLDPV